GLRRALQIASSAVGSTPEVRVMLFTDEQPNVGATSASAFSQMVAGAAGEGVGVTVLGLGLGLGQEVMNAMSHLRGGNAFSLSTREQADGLLADDWPWMAVPIAYDLGLDVACETGRTVAASYGF